MTSEENKILYMNKNIKAFPPYLAFTWDVIFVWAISTMFFTTQKGLSYSQTIMLDSILMLAGCLMCIPLSRLFQKCSFCYGNSNWTFRIWWIYLVMYSRDTILCIYRCSIILSFWICRQWYKNKYNFN